MFAATLDRLVEAGNPGLRGIIETGSVDASDPTKAVIQLTRPNGNLPVLVSLFNPQSIITPVAFETGTTLDGSPNGTGPFRLESYDRGRQRQLRPQPGLVGRSRRRSTQSNCRRSTASTPP